MSLRIQYILQALARTDKLVTSINYKTEITKSLKKTSYFTKGVLTRVDYYREILDDTELVLRVDMFYKRNTMGNAISRTTVRRYVQVPYNNEPVQFGDDIKITVKEYNPLESSLEGTRRRKNIINTILSNIEYFQESQQGYLDLYRLVQSNMNEYVDINTDSFKIAIENSDLPILKLDSPANHSVTIKDAILDILTLPKLKEEVKYAQLREDESRVLAKKDKVKETRVKKTRVRKIRRKD